MAAAFLAMLLAFPLLGGGRHWSSGVIGDGDGWQNLWNVDHVRRSICEGGPLLSTNRLWFPEGASLATHTLSLPFTLPAALASLLVGPPLAYNLVVLLSFGLAAAGVFRLGRRLGTGNLGAAAAGLCFAFAPVRVARAYGHLNLLGLGFLGFALEGLILTGSSQRASRVAGSVEAILAFTALIYCDLYLTLLALLAAACFCFFALLSERPRARRAVTFGAIAVAVGVLASPLVFRVLEDLPRVAPGHESKWCSVALTSLGIPSRIQVLSSWTAPLTERNHQNLVEGVGYLGWTALAATLIVLLRGRPRELDFMLVAGPAALLLSLGPQPRVFDRLIDLPLPYALLESIFPALRLGGCVNRFEQLAAFALALFVGFFVDRLRTRPVLCGLVLGLLAVEYLPRRIPVERWPLNPPDPALIALAEAKDDSAVLDVDDGSAALVRQLRHGHPMIRGYISRTPLEPAGRRREDPVLTMLLDPDARPAQSPDVVGAWLVTHYGVRYVIAPDSDKWVRHLTDAGLVEFARSPGRTYVAKVGVMVPPVSTSSFRPAMPF